MKAAVLHEIGGIPSYQDFPDPDPGEGEVVIDVVAVAVENVDKMIAAGTHFASKQFTAQLPAIPGFDGVGTLPDGTLVGFATPGRPMVPWPRRRSWPNTAWFPCQRASIRRSRSCSPRP